MRYSPSCFCLDTYCLTGAHTGHEGLVHFWWCLSSSREGVQRAYAQLGSLQMIRCRQSSLATVQLLPYWHSFSGTCMEGATGAQRPAGAGK